MKRGKAARAVTRTGDFSLGAGGALLTTAAGDVTKADTLKQALAGCGAVLFCASASKVRLLCDRPCGTLRALVAVVVVLALVRVTFLLGILL